MADTVLNLVGRTVVVRITKGDDGKPKAKLLAVLPTDEQRISNAKDVTPLKEVEQRAQTG